MGTIDTLVALVEDDSEEGNVVHTGYASCPGFVSRARRWMRQVSLVVALGLLTAHLPGSVPIHLQPSSALASVASPSTTPASAVPAATATQVPNRINCVAANGTALLPLVLQGSTASMASVAAAPATNAPAQLDNTVTTDFAAAVAFLYTGSNPVQTGVSPNTIDSRVVAVVRGCVRDRDGTFLPGVRITIHNHPEYGNTVTQSDGQFSMAVNGGGELVVDYSKDGMLPAQRSVQTSWRDYAWAEDVALVPLDSKVTTVYLASSDSMQVAQGSAVSDDSGTRTATLLVPQGTQAQMVLPDGSMQSLSSLAVRATEYTVGANGPAAMPGELPPQSGYTYALEYSVDEALAAGATEVRFSQPIYHYVENFLHFPAGTDVPMGYYDRQKAQWVASDNGRVVKVIDVTDGRANLDTNGDDQADNDPNLGISDAERQRLATLYQPGQSLWRVPITHFSSWDCNWGFGPPLEAIAAALHRLIDKIAHLLDKPCLQNGSIIECENQVLGEVVPVVGTPFSLHYQSDRVTGRGANKTISIPLSEETIPASLKRIDLELTVAGQRFTQSFAATPNQSYDFTWNGLDAYGRMVQGQRPVQVRIGYVYDGVYQQTARFGYNGNGIAISGDRTRREVTLWRDWQGTVGGWDARSQGLGGWNLNVHHAYDPVGKVLYMGDGQRRSVDNIPAVITTVAGNGVAGFSGDGGLATKAQLTRPPGVAIGPDGSIYIADEYNHRLRRVTPNGIITTIAGTGVAGFSGDGGPAAQAQLYFPDDVAIDKDGTIYVTDLSNHRVRRIGTDGIIHTIAGTGVAGFSGDGGLATQARLNAPTGVTLDYRGGIYVTDRDNHRVRKIFPDGTITTIAGTERAGYSGDDGPATQAQLYRPEKVVIGSDGSIFIADSYNHRVRQIGVDGIIRTVAGTGVAGYSGDGGLATQAQLNVADSIALGPDGSLYIIDLGNYRIRRVSSDGIITTIAGSGRPGYEGDNGPALQSQMYPGGNLAFGLDGSLYFPDYFSNRIRRIASPLPGYSASDIALPSEDGSELYQFSADGRHLRTLNTLTGATSEQFSYDGTGHLSSVTDGDGNITTIERDGNGLPTAIISPDNQRTVLTLNSGGYIDSITNPAGEANRFTYTGDGGLLTSMTDARGNASHYAFDSLGRLAQATDRAGGVQTFTRTDFNRLKELALNWKRAPVWSGPEEGPKDGNGRAWYDPLVDESSWSAVTLPDQTRDGGGTDHYYRAHFTLDELTPLSLHFTLDDGATFFVNGKKVGRVGFAWRSGACFNNNPLCSSYTVPDVVVPPAVLQQGDNVIAVDVWNWCCDSYYTMQVTAGIDGYSVVRTDALNRATSYAIGTIATGDKQRTVVAPDGTLTSSFEGSTTTNRTDAQSMATEETRAADPRFGMLAPFPQDQTTRTPAGLSSEITAQRSVALADSTNPLSLRALTETITLNNRTSTSIYNAASRQFSLTSPGNRNSQTRIDAQGRVTQEAVTGLDAVAYTYDTRGRLVTIMQGSGDTARTTSMSYNSAGYVDRITDPLGQVSSYTYDAVGRVTAETLPNGRVIGYSYDANGNLLTLTPSGRPAHTFAYTPLDLPATYTPPDLGSGSTATQYSYNLAHQLTGVTRPDGQTLGLIYDSAGRLDSLNTPQGQTSYTYDVTSGNLQTISSPGGVSLGYSYDGALPLNETWTGPVAGKVSRTYDNDFRVVSTSVNGSNTVNFSYDKDSLLVGAGSLTLSRNAQNGLLTGTSLGGISDSWGYNSFGEPTTYSASRNAATLYDAQYKRDKLGRITTKIETIGSATTSYGYSYDSAGRLVAVTANGNPTESYSYDANGNRLSATINGATATGSYDAQDRMLSYGATTYAYNANGDLTSKVVGGQATSYQYDVQGNLLAVGLPNGQQVSYLVDGQNRRIGRLVNGTLTQGWLYEDDLRPAAELNASGAVVSRFVYATHVNVPDYMVKNGVTYRIITDQLGSVRLVVNTSSGQVAQRIDYDSFGHVTQDTNPGFQPFGFAGGLYDPATGLVRFGARDYDAETGRWTTKDPIGFAGGDGNLYSYVSNDAVNLVDMKGEKRSNWKEIVCIMIGLCNFNHPTEPPNLDSPPHHEQQSPEWHPKNTRPKPPRNMCPVEQERPQERPKLPTEPEPPELTPGMQARFIPRGLFWATFLTVLLEPTEAY